MSDDVLVMILAGGKGSRLLPLTAERAKPAVPFGGRYRLIDFVLSNFVNSGFYRIKVLTQYKSESLNQHIMRGWRLASMLNHYVEVCPAQQRTGPDWYKGSADAIYQNLNLIRDSRPTDVCVFGADHIYKMDVRQMLACHREAKAALTVAAIPIPMEEAHQFGIIEVDENNRMIGFHEKPKDPIPIPGKDVCLASMGNYIFQTDVLMDQVTRDAHETKSVHDFGRNILTQMVRDAELPIAVYNYGENTVPGEKPAHRGYWRDVGTIESYWQSSMDLVSLMPQFDLYNKRWPIRTHYTHYPPAKFVHNDPGQSRIGMAINSIVAEGVIVSGGVIRKSILFPQVRVNSFSEIEESIVCERTTIGRHAKIRRAIIDKDVQISNGAAIGYDLDKDRQRFHVSENGIVVIPKGTQV